MMALPSRTGMRVPPGNSSATGSSILTSPRLAMSDNNSAVNSLVIATNFEQGFFGHRACAAPVAAAVGDEPMAVTFGDADHHADAQAALIDALDKQPKDRVIEQGAWWDNWRGHDHDPNATRTRRLAYT